MERRSAWSVAIVVRNVLPLLQVRRQLGLWPLTRSTVAVALAAFACFGTVDVVVLVTDLHLAVDATLLGLAAAVYLWGIWSRRASLGLLAFRSALRRVPKARARDPPSRARPSARLARCTPVPPLSAAATWTRRGGFGMVGWLGGCPVRLIHVSEFLVRHHPGPDPPTTRGVPGHQPSPR